MIISPRGEVLAETAAEVLRTTIDLAQIGNWYLDQRRDLSHL
ncbi:hypothetical protein AB0I81_18875 [Nonomuraea sp. NPDC050404]